MVLGIGRAVGGIGSRVGSSIAGSGAGAGFMSRIGNALKTPAGAGAAGFGLGEATDWIGLDFADGVGGDGALSGLLGGGTILWVFAGIAMLAVVSNLSGE